MAKITVQETEVLKTIYRKIQNSFLASRHNKSAKKRFSKESLFSK